MFVLINFSRCEAAILERFGDKCTNGVCVNGVNEFTCDCDDTGFVGDLCQNDFNECTQTPCKNDAACADSTTSSSVETNDYTCTCTDGYEGKDCDVNINECEVGTPCNNGARCEDSDGSFTCFCSQGYFGTLCDGLLTCPKDHFVYDNECYECSYDSTRDAGDLMIGDDTKCTVNFDKSEATGDVDALVQVSIVGSPCSNKTTLTCPTATTPQNEAAGCKLLEEGLNSTGTFMCSMLCTECNGTLADGFQRHRREEPENAISILFIVGSSDEAELTDESLVDLELTVVGEDGSSTVFNLGGPGGTSRNENIPASLFNETAPEFLDDKSGLDHFITEVLNWSEEQAKLIDDCDHSAHHGKGSKKGKHCKHSTKKGKGKGKGKKGKHLGKSKKSKKANKKAKNHAKNGGLDKSHGQQKQKTTTKFQKGDISNPFRSSGSMQQARQAATKQAVALLASAGMIVGFVAVVVGAIMKHRRAQQYGRGEGETDRLLGPNSRSGYRYGNHSPTRPKYITIEG